MKYGRTAGIGCGVVLGLGLASSAVQAEASVSPVSGTPRTRVSRNPPQCTAWARLVRLGQS